MKLTYENDVQIYELRKQGESFKRLSNQGLLNNWIAQYKKNGYTIVEKARGRPPKMGDVSQRRNLER